MTSIYNEDQSDEWLVNTLQRLYAELGAAPDKYPRSGYAVVFTKNDYHKMIASVEHEQELRIAHPGYAERRTVIQERLRTQMSDEIIQST